MDHTVESMMNYVARTPNRPRYYANDSSRDEVTLDIRRTAFIDSRNAADAPRLDREGFELVPHKSRVEDFEDIATYGALHMTEIENLIKSLTGAGRVVVTGPGILRFGEKSRKSGALNNSRPARFCHVDISDTTAEAMGERSNPEDRPYSRRCQYNIWRAISAPPQDVPLAVCDARSVAAADLMPADAIFDEPNGPEWSFEGIVVAANPAHRWHYFSNMTRDEALVFVTNDSGDGPHSVPHCAFDNPECPADTPPRASIEMRAVAYWYD